MDKKQLDGRIIKYLLCAMGLTLFVIYFSSVMDIAKNLIGIVFPLILGFVIAYALNIIMGKIEKVYFPKSKKVIVQKTRKLVTFLLSIIMILFVMVGVINIVVPEIIKTFASLAKDFPVFIDGIKDWVAQNEAHFPAIAEQVESLNIDWNSLGKNIADYAVKGVGSLFSSSLGIVSGVTGMVVDFVIAFAFAVYLIFGKERLLAQLKRAQKAYMSKSLSDRQNNILAVANETFSSYIAGQVTEAVILGTLCGLGMWILGFPYAITVGVFVGVTALIPVVGAYAGAGVGAFLILMVDPMRAVFFLIFIVVLQQLENNLIYPRVVGQSIGLPGIWVLATVVVGGGLFGILGMVIGVPFAATVYKLLRSDVKERLSNSKGGN